LVETGIVREVKGKFVTIAPAKSVACFDCLSTECKTSGVFLRAENPLGLPVEPGQPVEVETNAASLLPQALTALLPPIAGFAAGFILARLVFPGAGEAPAAFTGLALFFCAAFIVFRAGKKSPAGYKVTRILGHLP
jgi:sigma-E factor negative regulatory protein RseC